VIQKNTLTEERLGLVCFLVNGNRNLWLIANPSATTNRNAPTIAYDAPRGDPGNRLDSLDDRLVRHARGDPDR
jgi:hypothetical protein